MKQIPNSEVIEMLKSLDEGKKKAVLTYLHQRVYKTVRNFILRSRGSEQDAEDYFHEGLIAFYLLARKDKLAPDVNVEAYLYTICRNMWNKNIKKQPHKMELSEEFNNIASEDLQLRTLLSEERSELLGQLLASIGKECQQILIKFYFHRLSMKKIAEDLSISGEAVAKNKKSNCMKKLRAIVLDSPFYNNLLK